MEAFKTFIVAAIVGFVVTLIFFFGVARLASGTDVRSELRLPPVPVWEHQLPVLAQAVACNLVKDHGVLFRLPMAVHFGDWQTVVYSCERGWES